MTDTFATGQVRGFLGIAAPPGVIYSFSSLWMRGFWLYFKANSALRDATSESPPTISINLPTRGGVSELPNQIHTARTRL